MNRPTKLTAASPVDCRPPSGTPVRQEAGERVNPTLLARGLIPPASPTEGAGAPSSLTPNDGYGTRPRCTVCGRGFYGCICNVPEPDVMAVEDMKLVMPELFGLPNGWTRIGPL